MLLGTPRRRSSSASSPQNASLREESQRQDKIVSPGVGNVSVGSLRGGGEVTLSDR